MIGLLGLHGAMGERQQLLLAGILVLGIVQLSLWQREAAGWVWPGPKKDMAMSLLLLGGIGIVTGFGFLLIAPITRPANLAWYLAVGGLLVFNALQSTGIASRKRSEFREACSDSAKPARHGSRSAQWGVVAYKTGFVLVWLAAIAYLFLRGAMHWLGAQDQTRWGAVLRAGQSPLLRAFGAGLVVATGLLILFACLLEFAVRAPVLPRFGFRQRSAEPLISSAATLPGKRVGTS
jgi:hypothetical protein